MAGDDKKASRHFFIPLSNLSEKSSLLLFCKTRLLKGFTTFPPVCKKHTRDAEIRPFCPGFCLKSLSFLSFSEKCKNQGYFCK